ncbi:MAG: proton-conducting transporter membrane subunit, partial [Chthoniobacterales bacterium]
MLAFLVFCPLIGAILILAGAPARRTALLAAAMMLFASVLLYLRFDSGRRGFQYVTTLPVNAEWGLSFTLGVDGLSLIMLVLTAIVTLAAVWFSGKIEQHENAFYACLLAISGGALGAFASIDLFFFYAFHELALIPTFLLIGIWGSENRRAAAWKITIYLATGSFILLLGLILLYRSVPDATRSFDFRALQAASLDGAIPVAAQHQIYLILLIGFGILISLFPFHTWA